MCSSIFLFSFECRSPNLNANSLTFEVHISAEWAGPGVEIKQRSSRHSKQGDDGRSWKWGEQELEKDLHCAGNDKEILLILHFE